MRSSNRNKVGEEKRLVDYVEVYPDGDNVHLKVALTYQKRLLNAVLSTDNDARSIAENLIALLGEKDYYGVDKVGIGDCDVREELIEILKGENKDIDFYHIGGRE